jgi:hypothetical protein
MSRAPGVPEDGRMLWPRDHGAGSMQWVTGILAGLPSGVVVAFVNHTLIRKQKHIEVMLEKAEDLYTMVSQASNKCIDKTNTCRSERVLRHRQRASDLDLNLLDTNLIDRIRMFRDLYYPEIGSEWTELNQQIIDCQDYCVLVYGYVNSQLNETTTFPQPADGERLISELIRKDRLVKTKIADRVQTLRNEGGMPGLRSSAAKWWPHGMW